MTDKLTEAEEQILAVAMQDLDEWCDDREAMGIPLGHSYSAIMAFADALRQATRETAH